MQLGIIQELFSTVFGLGMLPRQRDMAASRLRRLRSGCCEDLIPPLLPIRRRKSFTGAGTGDFNGIMLNSFAVFWCNVKELLFTSPWIVLVPPVPGGVVARKRGGALGRNADRRPGAVPRRRETGAFCACRAEPCSRGYFAVCVSCCHTMMEHIPCQVAWQGEVWPCGENL